MTRKAKSRKKRDPPGETGLDEVAMAMGAYALILAGAVATGVFGSWLPIIGTTAAVYVAAWFANCRSKSE